MTPSVHRKYRSSGDDVPRHPGEQGVVGVGVGLEHVVEQGVVAGQSLEHAFPEPVAAAIAHVGNVDVLPVVGERRGDDGRAHALVLGGPLGDLDDLAVGPLDGGGEAASDGVQSELVDVGPVAQALGRRLEHVGHRGRRQRARDVAGVVSPGPVGQQEEPQLRSQEHVILVVLALPDVGAASADGHQRMRQHAGFEHVAFTHRTRIPFGRV